MKGNCERTVEAEKVKLLQEGVRASYEEILTLIEKLDVRKLEIAIRFIKKLI